MRKNKGITLVALVITIIVLIILAGVSINAVMNDGLINNSKEAKTAYDEAKNEEEKEISHLVVDQTEIEFLTKGIPYMYKSGYITGIEKGTTVETVLSKFPQGEGYVIYDSEGTNEKQGTAKVGTGMILKKGEEKIGTIIIFGDINGDGNIMITEYKLVKDALISVEYDTNRLVAMDANHDGRINTEDYKMLNENYKQINQNEYATGIDNLIVENSLYIEKLYVEKLKEHYNMQYNEEIQCYILTNSELTSTVISDFLALLPNSYVERLNKETNTFEQIYIGDEKASTYLQAGDEIYYENNGCQISLPIAILTQNSLEE